MTLTCEVDSYRSGWSVVEFLSHRFAYHTPERWRARVIKGWVRVNGADVAPEHVVGKGDGVSYTIWHKEPEVDARYDVVYEDRHLLAVSKSGNLPVHAGGAYIRNTLIVLLKNQLGEHLNLTHRLDRETSGLVVLSKDTATARAMGKMFADGSVAKSYLAVVHGRVTPREFEVKAPIGKVREGRRRCVDFDNGKPATTVFAVERYVDDLTVLRATPLSGRTHQIRVHLHHVGHPVVGDKLYSYRAGMLDRHALHCHELRFDHPGTGAPVRLRSEIPKDLERFFK